MKEILDFEDIIDFDDIFSETADSFEDSSEYEEESMFLKKFIKSMNSCGKIRMVSGSEINELTRLYRNCIRHYPLFAKLTIAEQIRVFQEAYRLDDSLYRNAKNLFDIFYKRGIVNEFIRFDAYIGRQLHYSRLINEDHVNNHHKGRPSDNIITMSYEWTASGYGVRIRQVFHVSELWITLTLSGRAIE